MPVAPDRALRALAEAVAPGAGFSSSRSASSASSAGFESPVNSVLPRDQRRRAAPKKKNGRQAQMAAPFPEAAAQHHRQQRNGPAAAREPLPPVPDAYADPNLASLMAEYEAAVAGLQADRASLQSEVQRVLHAEQARASTTARLQADRDALASENAELRKRLEGAAAGTDAADALKEANARADALAEELAQAKQQQASAASAVTLSPEAASQVAALGREMRALRGDVARAEGMLADASLRPPNHADAAQQPPARGEDVAAFRADVLKQLASLREERDDIKDLMARREASVASAVSTASASASLELARTKTELNAERERANRLADDLARVRESANRDLERVTQALKDTGASKVASMELSHQSAMQALEATNQQLETEKRDLLAKFETMSQEIGNVRNTFQVTKREWDAEAAEKITKETEKRLGVEQSLAAERAKTDGYLAQIEQLRNQTAEQNKLLASLQASHTELQQQCLDASASEVKSTKEVQSLGFDVKELKREKDMLEKRLEEVQFASDELAAALATAKEQAAANAARAARVETELRETAAREQRDHAAEVSAELAAAHAELASAKQYMANTFASEYQATVSSAMRAVKAELAEQRAALQRLEADASAVAESHKKSRSDATAKHREELARLETENGKLTLRARELDERVSETERELGSLKAIGDSLTAEKKALLSELENKDAAIAGERKQFEAKRRSLMSEKEELERQVYGLTKENEHAAAKFRSERAEWSDKVRGATLSGARENQELRERVMDLEAETTTLRGAKKNLEKKLSEAEKQLEGARENVRNKEALLWGVKLESGSGENATADPVVPPPPSGGMAALTATATATATAQPPSMPTLGAPPPSGGLAVANSTAMAHQPSVQAAGASPSGTGTAPHEVAPMAGALPPEDRVPGSVTATASAASPAPGAEQSPLSTVSLAPTPAGDAAATAPAPPGAAWSTPAANGDAAASGGAGAASAYAKYLEAHKQSGAPPVPTDALRSSPPAGPPPPLAHLPPRIPAASGMPPPAPATSSPAVMAAMLASGGGGSAPTPASSQATPAGGGSFNITSYQRQLQMQMHAAMGTTPEPVGLAGVVGASSASATQYRQLGGPSPLPPVPPAALSSAGLPGGGAIARVAGL